MIANATVDLPEPDSPTSPNASRGLMAKLRPGMTFASPARRKNETRALSSSRTGASITKADFPQPYGQKVEADGQGRDRSAGDQRHVRPDRHHPVRVLHHPAPIR